MLVVDDSAANRRALTQMLESAPDIEVLDRAGDGDEGLRKAADLKPDVITLDLEMPGLDGFAFLRLLMARTPTPVIVVSSYAHKSDVFKALELGAFDFIAKPGKVGKEQLAALQAELLDKVRSVRQVRGTAKRKDAVAVAPPEPGVARVVAVAASTGGPPAVQRLLEALSGHPVCVLVSQHMPPRFTRAFADRLNRIGHFAVSEAKEGDALRSGHAYVAPGGKHLRLVGVGTQARLHLATPVASDKHAPSADQLFESVAVALGARALAVVLTGMGADGARGALAVARAGGTVWAESTETAVIYGMPKEPVAAGGVKEELPLHEIGPAIARELAKKR